MPYLDPANYELPFASKSDTSRDAALKAQRFVGKQGIEVLAWFMAQGERGGTQKECERAGFTRSSVCARVNALEKVGNLMKTEQRRDGCAVYVAKGIA